MILRLDEKEEYGFIRVLPALNLKSDMNSGYAFQWYALTTACIFLWVFLSFSKTDRSKTWP